MLIGVDVGGTFTDLVLADDEGRLHFVKSSSTPDDPSRGVMDALGLMAQERGQDIDALLRDVSIFIHGTTVATNILVQRNGAKLGLITTAGFRDLIELREGSRSNRYALRVPAPEPIIERPLRLEVSERITADGAISVPLDEAQLSAALDRLRATDVESVVVCFLHAHRNPVHELAVRSYIERSGWTPFVSLGHESLGREGEYDRLSTAAVNAYVGPGLQAYLQHLYGQLTKKGIRVPVLVMQSTGGVLPIEAAGRRAIGAVTSGPAGGAMAGALFARSLGLENLVTFDTGGTSTDICVIQKGAPVERDKTDFADLRITAPAIEVKPIGIGGGSIARIDAGGILDLGPESAGATPGPACFMKGGVRATLTDANLLLGLISAETFLGGRMPLSIEAAREAIMWDVAKPLGLPVEEAAWAVHVLANSSITEGVRLATVRRGMDPRDFALMSFGGAGGLHANAVARELHIPTVVIPRMASVLSALGFLAVDIRQDLQQSVGRPIRDTSVDELTEIYDALEQKGRALLAGTGLRDDEVRVERSMDCHYARQVHGIPIRVGGEFSPGGLEAVFTEAYRRLYHHAHETESGIIETCRVAVFGALPKLGLPREGREAADGASARRGQRRIFIGRWVDADLYWFDDLHNGMTVSGPAVIDSASTSILILEGSSAIMDATGSLRLETPLNERAAA